MTLEFQVAVARQPGLEARESLAITLNAMTITAIVDGELPIDTLDQLVSLR